MKIAVIQFPGSNCERETMMAIRRCGMEPVEFLWNASLETLASFDGYVIIGGFSYEDRSRAGIIAACDPVMAEIRKQSEQGKPVLGICNGAQILVESGLIPGIKDYKTAMALTENKRMAHGKILGTGFYNAWIHMKSAPQSASNAFSRHLNKEDILTVPSAHAEGRFVMSDALLAEIEEKGLIAFQYCNDAGEVDDHFPVNPNGSMKNIAAVINPAGNIMAMMPHPERTDTADAIFQSTRDYINEGFHYHQESFQYTPLEASAKPYTIKPGRHEVLVDQMITDNQALSVQNLLQERGFQVEVKRVVRWEIDCSLELVLQQALDSGVIFNERKEQLRQADELNVQKNQRNALLVKAKDNLVGQQKLQILKDHFSVKGIDMIEQSILWLFSCKKNEEEALSKFILKSNIICNPYAYDCYRYE